MRYIFCLLSLAITLLTSVQFCQFISAEMCLKFIQTIHHSVNCRLCVLWDKLSSSVYTPTFCQDMHCSCSKQPKYICMNTDLRHFYGNLIPSVRSKLLMVSSSRKCKILFLMAVHCGVMCFTEKIVQDFHNTGIS